MGRVGYWHFMIKISLVLLTDFLDINLTIFMTSYNYCWCFVIHNHIIFGSSSYVAQSQCSKILFFLVDTKFTDCFQIVHWRNHLRFPDEAQLTLEAKDLIYRLLCDVDHRLGTRGAIEIKVRCSFFFYYYYIAVMLCQLSFCHIL